MKILIVTYTYPPAKSVNGFRPYYFAKSLVDNGWQVEVLTRHFTGTEAFDEYNVPNLTPYSYTIESGVLVHRVPHENTWFGYFTWPGMKASGLWKIFYFFQLLFGRNCQESYNKCFPSYLDKLLNKNKYNLILVESGPTNLVKTVSEFAQKFNLPYAIDLRDAFYHEMLKTTKLPFNKRIKIDLELFHMRDSFKKAKYVFGESRAKLNSVKASIENSKVILNGYDEVIWNKIMAQSSKSTTQQFTILIAGRLYRSQFLQVFLEGLKHFIQFNETNSRIIFLAPGDKEVQDTIHRYLPNDKVEIIKDRISYYETINYITKAHVLAYHGWKDYKGIYSTKIFDYLRSGKRIWILPSDHDVIEELVSPLQDSFVGDDIHEASIKLKEWYDLYEQGALSDISQDGSMRFYSRQFQSKLLVETLGKLQI